MRKATFVLVVATLASVLPTLSGQGGEPRKKTDEEKLHALMQKKLESSQKILEGLALGDFDKIGKHADELIQNSKQAEWHVMKTPPYQVQSNEFRRIAEALGKSAKDKNLDGAALNYVDLTLTCVKCHKYVREVRMTKLDE
jgi:hypothetical protein